MKHAIPLIVFILASCAHSTQITDQTAKTTGKKLAYSRDKGNCLACHEIEDGEFPGNIGPVLKNLTTRFKNKQQLRQQIWDARQFNPETSMPPFGKNKILSGEEIDLLVNYLWGLK